MVSKLLLWEMGTGQHVFTPSPAYWGNQSLRERPVPGLSERKVPGETPRPVSHSFFLPPSPGQIPVPLTPTLWRVLSSIDGVTVKKEAGGGNPNTRRHGAHGAFQSSSSPEAPHPAGAVGMVSLQEDPLHLEVVGPCRGEQARQVHGAGLIGWYILPAPSAPWLSILGNQACPGFRDVPVAQGTKARGE